MERPLVKLLLWVFIVFVQNHGGLLEGCLEEERIGLLKLKDFFNLNSSDETSDLLLPSWVDERESECCDWERVSCNHTTGRVVELNLDNLMQYKSYYQYYPYCLNVSLFKHFEELLSLDISWNGLDCYVENEGFERLSKLERLEILNVALNGFNNSILKSLGLLTSLKTLNVSHNRLKGPHALQELSTLQKLEKLDLSLNSIDASLPRQGYQTLSKLSKLEHLDLSFNNFNKDILKYLGNLPILKFLSLEFSQMKGSLSNKELANLNNLEVLILSGNKLNGTLPIQDLISFKNLEVLDLSDNMFTGNIPPHIGTMTSLKALSLAENNLTNMFPIQGLCKLRNLQELDLSLNTFEGILPPCLSNLRSLRVLDLSENQFKGDITFIISNLTSLEYINLNNNHFEGLFSFSSLANHSKLEIVEFKGDKMELETDHYSNWTPKFQLKALVLSNCNLNKLTREIPKFLLHQYRLRVVDLSHNNLKGVFPYWLLNNNARLEVLNLRHNSLTGQFDLPPSLNNNSIYWMDVSDNHFHGQLQETISRRLPYNSYLNLSRNSFEGLLPSSLCNMSDLKILDLSVNMFSGEVPKELVSGCINLSFLKLSRNKFHGQILSTHFNLSSLEGLQLDDNQFSGILSDTILKSKYLLMFDISSNYFSGVIPNCISNMTGAGLSILIMRNNSFKGRLPSQLAAFSVFDVSHNSLSGSLPSWSNPPDHIYLQANKFTGPIPNALVNSSSLRTLDIRDNHLSGNIPNGISALSNLRVLLLRRNHLDGLIPNQLCKLNKITLLDLANNFFSGPIPSCINNISFGKIGPNDLEFRSLVRRTLGGNEHKIDTYGSLLVRTLAVPYDVIYDVLDEAEFLTKRRHNSYKGDILNFMSGLDLSCNNLTGEIPPELGGIVWIHALNLSHNQLKGSIPKTFSSLIQLESLDLSYNKLSGVIPLELIDLHFLAVFSVAHNNLSGKISNMKAQFGTFDESSYEGNPYLCGALLEKNCTTIVESPNSPTTFSKESEAKWYEIDPEAFYVTFYVSYIMFLSTLASILAINPYWRRRWFNFIEERIYSSYYFVYDGFYKLLAR